MQSPTNSAASNPFLSTAPTNGGQKQSIVELFGPSPADVTTNTTSATKASDDLLALGNPFADMFSGKLS